MYSVAREVFPTGNDPGKTQVFLNRFDGSKGVFGMRSVPSMRNTLL